MGTDAPNAPNKLFMKCVDRVESRDQIQKKKTNPLGLLLAGSQMLKRAMGLL